jgi:hypothetical protein
VSVSKNIDPEIVNMSNEVRIGSLRLKFLIDDADNGGKLTMFEMTIPGKARCPRRITIVISRRFGMASAVC